MSSLNLSELFKIVHQAWNGETRSFHLETSFLKSAAIEKVISDFFERDFISLKECSEPKKVGDSVRIEIATVPDEFLKMAHCTAKIEFRLDASSIAQVTLIVTNKTESYYLGNSFETLQESTPGKIPFKNPEFTLRSDYDEKDYAPLKKLQDLYASSTYDEKFDERLKNGLSFKGRLSLGNSWDWIVEFISGRELDCSGPIQLIGDVPRMFLKTAIVENNIGPVSIPVSFDQITLFAASENKENKIDFTTISFSRLFGELTVKNSETPPIPVYTIVNNNAPTYLSFRSELTAFSRYALNSFSTLLSGQDLDAWIPEGLPGTNAIALEAINLELNLSPLKVDRISAQLGILKEEKFSVIPDVMQLGNINLHFLVSDPFSKNVRLDAEASGQLLLESAIVSGSIDSSFALSTDKSFYFNCALGKHSYINVTEFVKRMVSEDLSLPAIECSTLGIRGGYDNSGTSFGFESNIESDLTIPLGLVDVTVEQLGFKFDYKKTKADSKSLRLNGLFNLSEKAEVIVSARYSNKGWLFEGSLEFKENWTIQDVLPAAFPIPADVLHLGIKKVSVALDTGKKSLSLEVETDNFLSFGDFGRIENKGFSISIEKTEKGYDWDFTTKGALQLINTSNVPDPEWMIDIAGELSISASNSTKEYGMKFKSDPGSGSIKGIPLLIPYEFQNGGISWSEMEFRLAEIDLSHKASDGWAFNANFFLKFTKLIPQIKGYLPEKGIEVQLSIDKKKAEISLKNDVLKLPIPSITLPGLGSDKPNEGVPPFKTGESLLKVGSLTLTLGKKQVGVHAKFSYYLPEHLNNLLGTEENGEPKIKIFDTYNPLKPEEGKCLEVLFEGGYKGGSLQVGMSLSQIPISIITQAADPEYWALNFGPKSEPDKYGSIWIEKPVFKIDLKKGGFEASGGFKIQKDPVVPLDLFKALLEFGNLHALAKNLPDGIPIPIKEPWKFKDKDNNLDVKVLNDFFLKTFNTELPEVVREALNGIASLVNRMPESFTDYLELKIPDTLHFKMLLKPGGGLEVGFEADPGIKLLLIQPTPTPFITGIKLRSFSLGQLFSGQLFSVRLDADIDVFDIVTLAAAVITPPEFHKYIGTPRNFVRKVQIHNLLTLIVWQTQIPIPIPLFYDKLAIDYYGLGDVKLQSGFSFKEPGFNLQEIGSLFKDLIQFCVKPEFRLNPEKEYEDFNLKFKVLSNYIESGDYMGKEVFGLKEGFEISLYKIVAQMLNGIKFFDIVAFIQSIPIENRVGEAAIATDFFGMNAEGKFLLVSPEEFVKNEGYKKILPQEATAEDAKEFMKILPSEEGSPIKPEDKGLILFLKGMWNTDYSKLDTAFGLIAIDNKQFNTGFYLNGEIANLFDLDLLATLQINPPEIPFELQGKGRTSFKVLGVPIFSGEVAATANTEHFKIGGSFSLLEGNSLVYLKTTERIEGEITQAGLNVKGAIEGRFFIFTASGSVDISQEKVAMNLAFMNNTATFLMKKKKVDWQTEKVETMHINGVINVLWSQLNADVLLIPEKNHLRAEFNSSAMNNLLRLNAKFGVDINQSHIGAKGMLEIHVLDAINPQPVFKQEIEVDTEGMSYKGSLKLLPDAVPFDLVSSTMEGRITENSFYLKGEGSFDIGPVKLGGNININEKGIIGNAEGMFILYYLTFKYDIKFGEGLLSMGEVDLKMAGIPLFSGKSIFNSSMNKLNLNGAFSLLDLGSLLYVKSIEPMRGHIAPGVIQTKGNVEARFLIFSAKGTAEIGTEITHLGLKILGREVGFTISVAENHLLVAGTIPVGWNNLTASFQLFPYPVNRLISTLQSASIANLMRFKLQFDTTLNQSYVGATGKFWLYLLEGLNPNPIINGSVTIDQNGFHVKGGFQLLPDGSPFNIKGEIKKGTINDKGITLDATASIEIIGLPTANGTMTIDERGIRGSVNSHLGELQFGIVNCNGSVHIYGTYKKCSVEIAFHINDQAPYFHLAKSPCAPAGLEITQAKQEKGMLSELYHNANELLLEVMKQVITVLPKHQKAEEEVQGDKILFDEETLGRYQLKISDTDPINRTAEEASLTIVTTHLPNAESGLFEDIKQAVKEKAGVELKIATASIQWQFNIGNKVPERMVLKLPMESNKGLKQLELDADIFNSKRFMAMVIQAVKEAMQE